MFSSYYLLPLIGALPFAAANWGWGSSDSDDWGNLNFPSCAVRASLLISGP
jgi:hypothetical protein